MLRPRARTESPAYARVSVGYWNENGAIGTAGSHVANTDIPPSILHTGTWNDVARALGSPFNLAAPRYCCLTVFLSAQVGFRAGAIGGRMGVQGDGQRSEAGLL
jgi:hypothetical protein